MRKSITFVLLGVMCMFLFGCGGQKYHVEYNGTKSSFSDAKDYYAAGAKVKLMFDCIATDTDYTFYVDGEEINPDWENNMYVISFTMPDHDIVVDYSSHNSMVNEGVPINEMTPVKGLVLRTEEKEIPDGLVSMEAVELEYTNLYLNIYNKTDETISYGEDYKLQKKEGDEYVDVVPPETFMWIDVAYDLEPGQEANICCPLDVYGDITGGEYRLCKFPDLTADFEIIEEWTE